MRLALLACPVLAALSALLVDPAPAYDPWSWLVWGREIASGTLSTLEGPAFKPLPVAVTTLLSPLGDGAPATWVVLARAGALAALVCAFVLGRDLAGGRAGAGVLAAVGVALCGAFPTYAASGDVTGLLLGCALGGVLAWRADRPGLAGALAVACALLRVEAWPFALALGVLLWRDARRAEIASSPGVRGTPTRQVAVALAAVAAAVLVPAAWLVPEWIGSGDPLRSGARAQIPNPGQPALADVPALASLQDALGLALWPLLVGGMLAVVVRATRGLALAGLAWIVLVALMAQIGGFSGEARYALPGAALLTVLGAVVLARLPRAAFAVAAVLVVIVAAPRLAALEDVRADQAHQWRLAGDLERAVAQAGGRAAVLRCGTPYVGRLRGPLAAYRLRVAKAVVEPDRRPRPPGVLFRSRLHADLPVTPPPGGFGAPARRAGLWEVRRRCG